jgi:hypothetical protein
VGRDGEGYVGDLGPKGTEIFLREGLDRRFGDLPDGLNQAGAGSGNFRRCATSRWIVAIVNESFHPDTDAAGLSYH